MGAAGGVEVRGVGDTRWSPPSAPGSASSPPLVDQCAGIRYYVEDVFNIFKFLPFLQPGELRSLSGQARLFSLLLFHSTRGASRSTDGRAQQLLLCGEWQNQARSRHPRDMRTKY